MKSIIFSALLVVFAALVCHLAESIAQPSEALIACISPAEISAAFGLDDTQGLCCSLDTGGECADPDDWPWESGCDCAGLGCCYCSNTNAECFIRTSTLALHDECIDGDATEDRCGEVSTAPCFTFKHGTCGDDAGEYNPFWFCNMCGCDGAGAATQFFGTVTACSGTSTGC